MFPQIQAVSKPSLMGEMLKRRMPAGIGAVSSGMMGPEKLPRLPTMKPKFDSQFSRPTDLGRRHNLFPRFPKIL